MVEDGSMGCSDSCHPRCPAWTVKARKKPKWGGIRRWKTRMKEYHFPVVTDEYRIAFLRATEALCPDVQRLIWEEVLYCTQPIDPPPTPQKCKILYTRLPTSLPRNLFEEMSATGLSKLWMTVVRNDIFRYLPRHHKIVEKILKSSLRNANDSCLS